MLQQTKGIIDRHPMRIKAAQKQAFLADAAEYMEGCGFHAVESLDRYLCTNKNLLCGDLSRAEFLFTAHYDTPCRMFIPANTLFPRHLLLTFLAQLLPMLLLALLVFLLPLPASFPFQLRGPLFLVLALLANMAIPNKHNVNDNGSGLCMLFTLAESIPPEQRHRVAFVFFDHEEWGLLGSAAFARRYKNTLKDKTIFNFDCVGVGDDMLFFASAPVVDDAALFSKLKTMEKETDGKRIKVVNGKGYFYPSDQMNFKKSVGVAAFKQGPLGLYLNGIHVNGDTHLEMQNIDVLTEAVLHTLLQ